MTTPGALLDRETVPSVEDFAAACGPERRWFDRLVRWLESTYGVVGEPFFAGREGGWGPRLPRPGAALSPPPRALAGADGRQRRRPGGHRAARGPEVPAAPPGSRPRGRRGRVVATDPRPRQPR